MSKISTVLLAFSLFVSFLSFLLGTPLLADAISSSLDPLVAINPPELVVDPGDTFAVEVLIEDVSDLGSYEFKMDFDPNVVQVAGVEDAGFLGSTGRTIIPLGPDLDNEAGTVAFGAFSMGDQPGPDGDGTLATITLEAVSEGVTDLDLHDVKVLHTSAVKMAVTVEDGRVQVGTGLTPTHTPTEVAATPTPTGTPAATATSTPAPPGPTPTETPPPAHPTDTPTSTPTTQAEASETPTQPPAPTATPAEIGEPTSTPAPSAPTPTSSSYPSETKGEAGGSPPLLIVIGLAGIVAIALAVLWGKKLWGGQ